MAAPLLGAAALLAAYNWLDNTFQIGSDVTLLRKSIGVKRAMGSFIANNKTVADFYEERSDRNQSKEFLVMEERSFTYAQVEALANQVANWASAQGFRQGDTVALMMSNRPEYVITWLGFAKIGVTVALINYNLKGRALVHSVSVGKAKMLLFESEFADTVSAVAGDMAAANVPLSVLCGDSTPFAQSVDAQIARAPPTRPARSMRSEIKTTDTFALIYTSGTTGLPKAAHVPHLRFMSVGLSFAALFEVGGSDRVYTCLPLYHSAGGMCGVGMVMASGCTQVISKKFSATHFFRDCKRYRCTVVQYIGELCRYLLAVPPSAHDKDHSVRVAIGNGLRPDIWNDFQDRFNVPQVGEFYGATEGNTALVNHCTAPEHRGSVGRGGLLFRLGTGIKLAKFDVENEVPVRGPDGFCIAAAVGEPGELLGLIKQGDPSTHFKGYTDAAATEKKLIRNAFKKGDCYFRTGDLLSRDANGCWQFVDRIGDTFRWAGENVATTEVAEAVSTFPGVLEANVYGVQVPGKDGRAPMAGIVVDEAVFQADRLFAHLDAQLPSYAIPRFLRLMPQQPLTGTLKHQKVALRQEGCDPTEVQDPLLWLTNGTYRPLDAAAYLEIVGGRVRL